MRAGESFDIAVNDVVSRLTGPVSGSRKDSRTRHDEDTVELEDRLANSKGKVKFDSEAPGSLAAAPSSSSSLATGLEGILGALLAFSETRSFSPDGVLHQGGPG